MKHTPEAAALTNLILEVFRLNGQLLSQGDRLTQSLGLTSARWQVLGAIGLASQSMSVAQIGRRMGLSRQAVQRVANDLEALRFISFEPNPDHARAKLIATTAKGCRALKEIDALQIEWSNKLASGLEASKLGDAVRLLEDLQSRCQTMKNEPMKVEE